MCQSSGRVSSGRVSSGCSADLRVSCCATSDCNAYLCWVPALRTWPICVLGSRLCGGIGVGAFLCKVFLGGSHPDFFLACGASVSMHRSTCARTIIALGVLSILIRPSRAVTTTQNLEGSVGSFSIFVVLSILRIFLSPVPRLNARSRASPPSLYSTEWYLFVPNGFDLLSAQNTWVFMRTLDGTQAGGRLSGTGDRGCLRLLLAYMPLQNLTVLVC